ncbi:MAG: galactose-1-phosphate uridylyltransferase [Thermosipho sp. (in: Bacteria)]|nr:galactose-1-phosphate uridylyltransferase [Thermosipho sp. (in: thermotogales)]
MMELRYNPLTDEWVIVSAATQKRPVQPAKTQCPICPGGIEFPDTTYDLVAFENRFPSLMKNPPKIEGKNNRIFRKRESFGVCEVVVYTSQHDSSFPQMPLKQIEKLVDMWVDRTYELSKYDFVKNVFIFENRGKEVGASLPHPHGQIYAFPFIPKRIEAKINSMEKWYAENGKCVVCDVIENETKERIVRETDYFIAFVPFYARFPFEVHVYPKRHLSTMLEFSYEERKDFAKILKIITMKYDKLFDQEFPYMMMFFQAPFNTKNYSEIFHFHVEFNPPKRDKDKIKWMASVETGTWAFINPVIPEEAARMLREVEVEI